MIPSHSLYRLHERSECADTLLRLTEVIFGVGITVSHPMSYTHSSPQASLSLTRSQHAGARLYPSAFLLHSRVSTTRRRQRTLRTIKLSTDLEDTNNSLFNFYSRHSAPVAPRKPRLMTREPVSATTLALANRKRRTSEYTPTNAFEDFPAIPPFLGFCTRKDVMIPVEDMQGFYER